MAEQTVKGPAELLAEGKTKCIYAVADDTETVIIQSKDRITAGDGTRAHDLAGKARIANETTCKIFELLAASGLATHYVSRRDATSFVARRCHMVPIEWVARRVATGSFLKRNPGVKEGHRFVPLKQETFFKDDANNDPMYSEEQIVAAEFCVGARKLTKVDVDVMRHIAAAVFDILEKLWASLQCSLIDMKIEFGVDATTGRLLVADVIDSDSWRLWPSGDPRLMKDKQVYRNLKTVTTEDLERVRTNFQWVNEQLERLDPDAPAAGRVLVLMGSTSDRPFCDKIRQQCDKLKVPCQLRVTSAHKGPEQTLTILAEAEADARPTVVVAVAGRSNGLGPVSSGNCQLPVINCPPSTSTSQQDVWSSLNTPSGLGCSTVLYPEAAALCAAQSLALHDAQLWAKLRARRCNNVVGLIEADAAMQAEA